MQPDHLNVTDALVKTEHAGVAGLDNESPDRDQRRKILALPVQKTDSFCYTSRRKVSAAETADLDRPGEPILQCDGNRLPRKRPVPDDQNRRNAEDERDENSHDRAPKNKRGALTNGNRPARADRSSNHRTLSCLDIELFSARQIRYGGRGVPEMKGVPQVLQLAVIIKRSGPPTIELQPLQKLDFLFGRVAAEGSVFQELFQTRLRLGRRFMFLFQELKSLDALQGQSAVQHDFHAKGLQVDVPGFDQRIEKRRAVFDRHMEDIRIQKLKNHDPRLFIASIAEPGYQAEPVFTFQFFFGDSLGHIQKLLRYEAFDFTEGLVLEDRAHLFAFAGRALEENQFANLAK